MFGRKMWRTLSKALNFLYQSIVSWVCLKIEQSVCLQMPLPRWILAQYNNLTIVNGLISKTRSSWTAISSTLIGARQRDIMAMCEDSTPESYLNYDLNDPDSQPTQHISSSIVKSSNLNPDLLQHVHTYPTALHVMLRYWFKRTWRIKLIVV